MFWTNTLIDILLFFYVLDCAFMGLVIMMQRSKQEGLGAAFGGGVMSDTFGAQTSNVLVKATTWAAIIFFCLSIILARLYSETAVVADQASPLQQLLSKPVKPATPAPVAPTPTTSATTPTSSAATMPTPVPPAPAAPATPSAPAAPASK